MKISLDASFIALQARSMAYQSSASAASNSATTNTEDVGTTVQISPQAQALSAQSTLTIDASGLPPAITDIANHMASNPDGFDMSVVEEYANQPEQQLVSLADPNRITYTGNGEPVTASNTAAFNLHAAAIIPQKQAILQQGIANGEDAAQIFVSLARFISSQPLGYLQETDWFGK